MDFERLKVLRLEDKGLLMSFEQAKSSQDPDPMAFMKNWSSPWREESLDHYLSLGWCMAHIFEGEVKGYVLVQPILFFLGHTQSLWIESVRAQSEEISAELFEAIVKVSKDKHMQQVFFNSNLLQDFESHNKSFKIETHSEFSFIKTTRWEN